jgi:hypothetical protein
LEIGTKRERGTERVRKIHEHDWIGQSLKSESKPIPKCFFFFFFFLSIPAITIDVKVPINFGSVASDRTKKTLSPFYLSVSEGKCIRNWIILVFTQQISLFSIQMIQPDQPAPAQPAQPA